MLWYWNKLILTLVISTILLSSIVSIPPVYSLNLTEDQKLVASDRATGDTFGTSVSIFGDTLVVSANNDQPDGAIYVYEKIGGTWTEIAKLTPSDTGNTDNFGRFVKIFGDTVIVGNDRDNNIAGAVYVFEKPAGGWVDATEDQKLFPSDPKPGKRFGFFGGISGDTLVVGAPDIDDGINTGPFLGAAYIFEKNGGTWTQVAKLTSSDNAPKDSFGTSVDISGDTAVVGANRANNVIGAAYVFVKPGGGWANSNQQDAKLTAGSPIGSSNFGQSVSISGDTVLIGERSTITRSGDAMIFEKPAGGWVDATRDARLQLSDGMPGGAGCCRVSISGDNVILGADFANDLKGAAYFFEKPAGGWVDATEDQKLTASDAEVSDEFGIEVSISGDTAIVGAIGDDSRTGAAYVFAPATAFAVGGELIPIESTSLILAGAQSFSWMIPVVLSVIGIGLFVVSRKSE